VIRELRDCVVQLIQCLLRASFTRGDMGREFRDDRRGWREAPYRRQQLSCGA
jgi:hypothetical protein